MLGLRIFGVAALLWALPAAAKDVTLTLTEQEQQGLYQALDAAVKARGMEMATFSAYLWQKVQIASQAPVEPSAPAKGGEPE